MTVPRLGPGAPCELAPRHRHDIAATNAALSATPPDAKVRAQADLLELAAKPIAVNGASPSRAGPACPA
jgi:hypothetical protein